jgi:glycosyltransferase involved in cell wall biosynthesis
MLFKRRTPRYDLTFICRRGKSHFAEPILRELGKRHTIQCLYPEHTREYSRARVLGRVIWVEWGSKFARLVCARKWKDTKVFVRVHRYEMEEEIIRRITWRNVDEVVFVNRHFEDRFRQCVDGAVRTATIPNALSVDDFDHHPVRNTKRLLAYSPSFDPRKGYVDLLRLFARLLKRDGEFTLTIMARKPLTQSEAAYLGRMRACIRDCGIGTSVAIVEREGVEQIADDRENINEHLSQHDAIISYSERESFHCAFAEGLLCGLQGFYAAWRDPLIADFWSGWAYDSEDDMLQGILTWSGRPLLEKQGMSEANRAYVIEHFGSRTIGELYEREFFSQ